MTLLNKNEYISMVCLYLFKNELNNLIKNNSKTSVKEQKGSDYKKETSIKWSIAIILNYDETMKDDNNLLIELVNNLPKAMQAYHNITNTKPIAVVSCAKWEKNVVENAKTGRSSTISVTNTIARQDASGAQSWYGAVENKESTMIDIFAHLFTFQDVSPIPSGLPSGLVSKPKPIIEIPTVGDFISDGIEQTDKGARVYHMN